MKTFHGYFINIIDTVIFLVVILGILMMMGWFETHYTREATVIEANDANVLVEDNQGRVWAFEGDGYGIGQRVSLTMNTKGTDNIIEDDEVVSVKSLSK